MITDEVMQNAASMLRVPICEVPEEFIDVLEEVESLLCRVRPAGSLRSTQVMAMLVYNYKKENGLT